MTEREETKTRYFAPKFPKGMHECYPKGGDIPYEMILYFCMKQCLQHIFVIHSMYINQFTKKKTGMDENLM